MGTIEAKLYNKTLDEKKDIDITPNSMYMLFDEENDSTLKERHETVMDLLPDGWGSAHVVFATANCGTIHVYDSTRAFFVPAVNVSAEVQEKFKDGPIIINERF